MIKTVFRLHRRLPIRHIIAVVILLGLAGFATKLYISSSSAVTAVVPLEAENGSRTPNAKVVQDPTASNGQAVAFGAASGGGGSCIAPAGLKVTDIDYANDGDPLPIWRHTLGSPATIYFATNGVPAQYAAYVQAGAAIWNVSPCVKLNVVDQCPSGTNCVKVQMGSLSGNADGQFSWTSSDDNNGYFALNDTELTLVASKLDSESEYYRKVVVGHEMGHAVSLQHRLTKTDIMNWASDESAALSADTTNLNNILALYGVASPATSNAPAQTAPANPAPSERRSIN